MTMATNGISLFNPFGFLIFFVIWTCVSPNEAQ